MGRSGDLVVLVAMALAACGDDPPTEPTFDPDLAVSPSTQWAGGTVQATSETFGAIPFAILLDGDTLEVTSSGGPTVDVVLPNPRLTGPATLELHVEGAVVSEATVQIVGAAREPREVGRAGSAFPASMAQLEGDAPYSYHGVGLPTGQLLAFLRLMGPDDNLAGIGVVDLNGDAPTASILPGLEARLELNTSVFSGLLAAGLTNQPDSWLVEASPPDSAAPPVRWAFTPGGTPQDTLACLGDGLEGGYIVAELPTGDCLVLNHASPPEFARFTLNGVTTIPGYGAIPRPWRAGCVGFRGGGGTWITVRNLRGREGTYFCADFTAESPPAWPVFASDGSVGFASDRYPDWPKGVDFTPGGDTLWVAGETGSSQWSLDVWDPSSEQLLDEVALDGVEACWDVRVDVLTPRVYVACRFIDVPPDADDDWPSLLVYDRQLGEVVAVLHTPEQPFDWPVFPPFELVHAVAAGNVHLTAVWDGTSAPVDRGLQVASWDVF